MKENLPVALFAANRGYALSNSRKGLIQKFLNANWRVVLATADDDHAQDLVRLGAELEPVDFDRGGLSVLSDVLAYRRMSQIYRAYRPVMAHHFNAKPVIAGTLAARRVLKGDARVFNTITGLGHAFVEGGMTAWLAGMGYRFALPHAEATVFQNSDDRDLFLRSAWLEESKARLILGSGVDINRFDKVDRTGRDAAPVIVMIGRLLRQKGIPEFVEVASRIHESWPDARFLLVGEEDPSHPDAVSSVWIHAQQSIEYLGQLADVAPILQEADLLLFPSYYREGLPRVVMEAAATGLPTIGFEVPGVREAIRNGVTGYLCPDRDVDALEQRVLELLENPERRVVMGKAARSLAEKEFDIESIQQQYISLYREAQVSI